MSPSVVLAMSSFWKFSWNWTFSYLSILVAVSLLNIPNLNHHHLFTLFPSGAWSSCSCFSLMLAKSSWQWWNIYIKWTNIFHEVYNFFQNKIIHLHKQSNIAIKFTNILIKANMNEYSQNGHQQDDDDEHLVDLLLPCQPLHELLLLFHKPKKIFWPEA